MMKDESGASEIGKAVGEFAEWLTLIFAALRASDAIDWAWWWVLSPMLCALALSGVLLLIAFAGHLFSRPTWEE